MNLDSLKRKIEIFCGVKFYRQDNFWLLFALVICAATLRRKNMQFMNIFKENLIFYMFCVYPSI